MVVVMIGRWRCCDETRSYCQTVSVIRLLVVCNAFGRRHQSFPRNSAISEACRVAMIVMVEMTLWIIGCKLRGAQGAGKKLDVELILCFAQGGWKEVCGNVEGEKVARDDNGYVWQAMDVASIGGSS